MILARELFGAVGLRLQSRNLGLLPATIFSPFAVALGQRQFANTCASACSLALLRTAESIGVVHPRFALSRTLLQRSDDSPGRRANFVAPVARLAFLSPDASHEVFFPSAFTGRDALCMLHCLGLPAPDCPASALFAFLLVVRPQLCELASPLRFFALRTWCGRA
jgi:hypothetical protein